MRSVKGKQTGGALRRVLQAARLRGVSMSDLTVLASQNDPYRHDTPVGHREGQWFAKHFESATTKLGKRVLHLRGVHYAIVSWRVTKPNGLLYTNTNTDWRFLLDAAKAARWLCYVPFTSITDNRAATPIIHRRAAPDPPWPRVLTGLQVDLPDALSITPTAYCNFEARQPFHLVIFGEKSSLADVVMPIAERFEADVYLETGEISDTHIYQMAADNAQDGRPLRVFTLADCDPSGWQMAVSIGRKLQALKDLLFPNLDFEVWTVALTPTQVRELNLPETPLKESEQRASDWSERMGVEQTEIDALATLRPEVLTDILEAALAPFFDTTLSARISEAEADWEDDAQSAVDEQVDKKRIKAIRAQAAKALKAFRAQVTSINKRLDAATRDINLPNVNIPEPEDLPETDGKPLISSAWDWAEQTRALKARKAYEDEN